MSEKEKKFLNDFATGHINASINDSNRKLFKTKKAKKDVYDKNNARNRCSYTKAKAMGALKDLDSFTEDLYNKNVEDDIIDLIDSLKNPDSGDDESGDS